ncbi:hypothetical protein MA16_Dca009621 [Dendrobium catenatum]|uniref:Uncharacterized protein n=1 Tax=Dendrobium catenatum TaxID=906689 RepID=A0A2I0VSJ4_9ASPA|nr:hypothetical protein MA16_Dca009621 [Dendrobium catenatum]
MNLPLRVDVISVSHKSSPHQTFFLLNSVTAQIHVLFIKILIKIMAFQKQRKRKPKLKMREKKFFFL